MRSEITIFEVSGGERREEASVVRRGKVLIIGTVFSSGPEPVYLDID